MTEPLLSVRDLSVSFAGRGAAVRAVDRVSFDLHSGETLGVVGESGSGKTQLFLSLLGLLAKNGEAHGEVFFNGQNLFALSRRERRKLCGAKIAMIFQDPMTSLNPNLRIARQMTEVLTFHQGLSGKEARKQAVAMLERVGIADPDKRVDLYPHEFSGGMRQRVMIAMALLCNPEVLVADEPTTALDVTVQAQILDLLRNLKHDLGTAIVMITHDLGVVAGLCERVMVMYAGRIAELGGVDAVFAKRAHPYTQGLLLSMPQLAEDDEHQPLQAIRGQPPNLQALPPGCAYAPRCPQVHGLCHQDKPPLVAIESSPQDDGKPHASACWLNESAKAGVQADLQADPQANLQADLKTGLDTGLAHQRTSP